MALIVCRDLSFSYEGNVVVGGLNFEVCAGDYLCVVGENGTGKSTLIKGLARLKSPCGGEILMGEGLGPGEIGYLPQQAAAKRDFPASAYEVVLSGRLSRRGLLPFYSKEDKREAKESLNSLGAGEVLKKCYRELSGGQQRRVLLARALCLRRRLLLLDEPAAGLDPVAARDLYRLIEWINREMGVSIIMVSHDIHSAVKYAGKILHLRKEQAFFGTAEEYVRSGAGDEFLGGDSHR